MSAPKFNDLGKRIKDIFENHFPAGFFKVSANIPKVDGIALNLTGSHNIDSGKLLSSIDTKINVNLANKVFLLTEKWTTSKELQSILEVSPIENLKSSIQINFEPSTGRKSVKFLHNYATEMINASAEIECRQLEPILTLSSIFKMLGSTPLYGGGLVSFDTFKQKFDKIGYGVQYNTKNTCISGTVTNHNDLLFQAYQHTPHNVDVGVETGWKLNSKVLRLGIAVKYNLDEKKSIKAKLENNGNLSLGFTFPVRDDIKLTFGARLDCKNINGGGHKLGLQLEI